MTVDARAFVPVDDDWGCFVSRANDCEWRKWSKPLIPPPMMCREERPVFHDEGQVSPNTTLPRRENHIHFDLCERDLVIADVLLGKRRMTFTMKHNFVTQISDTSSLTFMKTQSFEITKYPSSRRTDERTVSSAGIKMAKLQIMIMLRLSVISY